ncbi:NADP-dependent glyceraldehyde-3-phosphate dehydrogenase [Urechidicola sp. KH5]
MKQLYDTSHIPAKYQFDFTNQDSYLLNGELKKWSGPVTEVKSAVYLKGVSGELEPATLGTIPNMSEVEALNALDAAVDAYDNGKGCWPQLSLLERLSHIEDFLEYLKPTKEAVVKMMMWEIGKSYEDSCAEFDRTITYIEDTIREVKILDSIQNQIQSHSGINAIVKRSPLGVVLCMGPYNYPLNEGFCLLIPALLCGNTAVFKPARYGVLLLVPLVQAFQKCFPKGVVNFIYGSGHTLATPIMKSGKVDVLALIGNSSSANALLGLHPKPNRLKLVLGLEAKNVAIILKDSDLDVAVNETVLGSLAFNGQRCTALKIIFVQEEISEEFNERFAKKVDELKIGMPWEKGVQITPLPEPHKPDYIQELIDNAKKYGADILNINGNIKIKNLVFPTVVYPSNEKMKVFHEEQFGPIVPIASFKSAEEALGYIENSRYGQQVSLFSGSSDSLDPLVRILQHQVSRVNINTKCQRGPDVYPFVGRKDSAVSALSVLDAIESFSIKSMIALRSGSKRSNFLKELL